MDKLIIEINQKSGAISIEENAEKLTENMIKKICELYKTTENDLLEILDANNVITRTNMFKVGGYDFIKENYPQIFEGVNTNKVRKSTEIRKKITVRTSKYAELKDLWEQLNEKVILEYKFKNETEFKGLLCLYLALGWDITARSVLYMYSLRLYPGYVTDISGPSLLEN